MEDSKIIHDADVLEVIEGHQLPPTKDALQTDNQTHNAIRENKATIEKILSLLAILKFHSYPHFRVTDFPSRWIHPLPQVTKKGGFKTL